MMEVPSLRSLFCSQSLSADRTGLEPATSAVTGRHSNQLNYRSRIYFKSFLNSRNDVIINPVFQKLIYTKSLDIFYSTSPCQIIAPPPFFFRTANIRLITFF